MSRIWIFPTASRPELLLTHVNSRLPADILFSKKVDLISCETQSVKEVVQNFKSPKNKLAFCGDKIRVQFFTDPILPKKQDAEAKASEMVQF